VGRADLRPKEILRAPYVGHKGWIGVRLHVGVDRSVVTDLAREAFRMTAPKRLAGSLDLS
jgi:predicted DNA-binding protein (MmcQ/YjbR family)